MIRLTIYSAVCVLLFSFTCYQEKAAAVPDKGMSVAFYNLDNLFDDVDDTDHNDHDFTPDGKYKWTKERYQAKLNNMAKVIETMVDGNMPDVLGVCELESKKAFEDLLSTGGLKGFYGVVHYNSPDERGIDVALAYNKNKLSILGSQKVTVKLSKDPTDKTRDQLYVKALVKSTKDTLNFYVCHFPSRKEGKEESEINRTDAARTCRSFLDSNVVYNRQNLIVMGDFNDEPWDKSISEVMQAKDIANAKDEDIVNLMCGFKTQNRGSYKFQGTMSMIDQFMISKALRDGEKTEYVVKSANILDQDWLTQKGKYNGYPLRTFGGIKWLNGYSDHYAVYMFLKW